MTLFRGNRMQPGERLKARDVDALFDAADRSYQVEVGQGLTGTATEHGILISPQAVRSYAFGEGRLGGDAFLAKLVFSGPEDEPDYDDARYWVLELFEGGENSHVDDRLSLEEMIQDPENEDVYPTRQFTATNLAEWRADPNAVESHALGTDGSAIVRVHMVLSPDGTSHFYFRERTPDTGAVIVRDILDGQSDVVTVQAVRPVFIDERRVYQISGAAFPMLTWPGFFSYHYEGHVWLGEQVQSETHILPAVRMWGDWHVQQMPRWRIRNVPTGMRTTDCSLVSFLAKGLTSLFERRG